MRIRGASRLVAAALVGACGCLFIAVRRPPRPPAAPSAPLECTESRVAPALDTAGAIVTPIAGLTLWGLCTFASAMQSWSSDPKHLSCGLVLGGTALSTAAYTASAVYGFRAAADCRRLAEQQRMTSLRREMGGFRDVSHIPVTRWAFPDDIPGGETCRPQFPSWKCPSR